MLRKKTRFGGVLIKSMKKKWETVRFITTNYYQGLTQSEFILKLDYENLDWCWFDKDDLPEPLFPMLGKKIEDYE